VPTDLWIDGSGCLRRIRATFQIGEPEITEETNRFSGELRLRDLGLAPLSPAPLSIYTKQSALMRP
jgi:hypothetical protein